MKSRDAIELGERQRRLEAGIGLVHEGFGKTAKDAGNQTAVDGCQGLEGNYGWKDQPAELTIWGFWVDEELRRFVRAVCGGRDRCKNRVGHPPIVVVTLHDQGWTALRTDTRREREGHENHVARLHVHVGAEGASGSL
jgi:hypothetical protein